MTCVKCNSKMSDLRVVKTTGEYRGEKFTIEVQGRECEKCGHVTIPGRSMPVFMIAVADAYRVSHGLLTTDEIKQARARLRLSQVDFAEYVGIGLATLKRAELGEVQSKGIDELIRVKTDTAYAQQVIENLFRRIAAPAVGPREDKLRRQRDLAPAEPCGLLAA
jgi:putative zinc finger/helix-turn-helix YgiT family protein